jgi:hypothetical protein
MSDDERITIPKGQFVALLKIYSALLYNRPEDEVREHVEFYRGQYDKDSGK